MLSHANERKEHFLRVLLVEDDEMDAELVRFSLEEEQRMQVELAVHGTLAEAKAALMAQEFEAVILDLGLPDSNGPETLKSVLRDVRDTPVIVASGNDDLELAKQCLDLGASDYLVKGSSLGFISDAIYKTIVLTESRRKLQQAHANLEQVLSDSQDAIVVVDVDRVLRFANQQAHRLFEGRFELGDELGLLISGGDFQEVDVPKRSGEVAVVEMRVGETTWYGKPAQVVTFRDVTERIADKARLDRLNRMLQAIRDINQLGVRERSPVKLTAGACEALVHRRGYLGAWFAILDANGEPSRIQHAGFRGKFRFFEQTFLSGEGPSCLSGERQFRDIRDSRISESSCKACDLWNSLPTEVAICIGARHLDEMHGLLGVALPLGMPLDKEEEAFLSEVAEDLALSLHSIETERRRNQSERKLRTLYETMEVGVIYHDDASRIIDANQAAERILGRPLDELCGREFPGREWQMLREDGSELEPSSSPIALSTRDGLPHQAVIDLRGPRSVEPLWLKIDAIPESPEGEQAQRRGFATMEDLTELRSAERAARELELRYQRSQKMEAIGRLAGGIAHDFNNLLTVINSYSEFAFTDLRDGDPLKADIRQVMDAGDRASALTRQLLIFSRKQVMDPRVIDLNKTVGEMEKMLQRMIGEDIDFVVVLDGSLWRVEADPGQIEQVIMNLAVNARDAMPRGGRLTIETSNCVVTEESRLHHPETEPGNYVRIVVSDTGTGMTADVIERAFEPFFTTKEQDKGTGLGLATVYGIVKQMEGSIAIESEVGRGTAFSLYFPYVQGKEIDEVDVEEALDVCGSETILVVEDEPSVRELTRRMLTSAGYTVITAANGGEALIECERHGASIDLLLTDVVMPKMSGKELADRLSALGAKLKVLYMSGYTDDAITKRGKLDTGAHFVSKPFNASELLPKVRSVLDSE